jgi:nicotinamide riboside transporter PnuC
MGKYMWKTWSKWMQEAIEATKEKSFSLPQAAEVYIVCVCVLGGAQRRFQGIQINECFEEMWWPDCVFLQTGETVC